jgi:hypothetical protein
MSNGDGQPPVSTPAAMGDADGDGLPNIAEAAIDSNARYQARIALITAIVALVSALLGPLVSLKINSDQIESQADRFKEETAANTGQSEAEFVRTQQSTAYTEFLTAFNNATLDLLGAAGVFGSPGNPPQALAEQETKAVQAVKDVTAAYYKVRIVAGEDAFKSSQALYAEFATWSGSLLQVGAKVLGGEPLSADEQALLDPENTNAEYQTLLGLSIDFIDHGRTDFNVEEADQAES